MGKGASNYFPPALFFFFTGNNLGAQIPLSGAKDQSTVAQGAEMTVDERSLTCCVWTRFPDAMPGHYSQPTPIPFDQGRMHI